MRKTLEGWHGQPHFDPRKLAAMSPLKRDVQLAAWTIVANMILNLDETITKG